MATSQLYGANDEQRLTTLDARSPLELPWVARQLEQLDDALGIVLGP